MSMDYLENMAAPPLEKEEEVAEAIEEIVAAYGMSCFVKGLVKSSASDSVSQVGQNAILRCISWTLRDIVRSENPQLTAEIMAMGAGVLLQNERTMTELAEKWGLTRAAISKQAVSFCENWSLPPSSFMKSEAARVSYSLSNQPKS